MTKQAQGRVRTHVAREESPSHALVEVLHRNRAVEVKADGRVVPGRAQPEFGKTCGDQARLAHCPES